MMRCLDDLYFEDPTRGTRRVQKELLKLGFKVGRLHVRTLMRIMRLKTVYFALGQRLLILPSTSSIPTEKP